MRTNPNKQADIMAGLVDAITDDRLRAAFNLADEDCPLEASLWCAAVLSDLGYPEMPALVCRVLDDIANDALPDCYPVLYAHMLALDWLVEEATP